MGQKRLEILLLVLASLSPLLWYSPDHIIAKGDYFPAWLNPWSSLGSDISLWSPHNMGNTDTMGAFMLADIAWLTLRSLGLSVGFIQILFQVFALMGGGLSMYYLSRTAYSELKIAAVISGIFYTFNFFVLQSRLTVGVVWTYAFLPLLMALLIKVMKTTVNETKAANKNIIYFAIISTITLSIGSMNPANVIIVLFVLGITSLYYFVAQRNETRALLIRTAKLVAMSVFINLWWMVPILNYYLLTPSSTFNPEISVTAWSWTHARASFLNLFWLNGVWGWRPEYVPYIDTYSNPLLIISTFVPFFLAAAALLFRTDRFKFNAYLMLTILTFLFLAKGLNEPLSQLNVLLYTYVPYMTMFREPASKFTMALIPFLSLLIGYAVYKIANTKIGRVKPTKVTKILIVAFFSFIFIISAYPLVTNPIETKTPQIPFSSYIKIPSYWYEATDWLNNKLDDYRVLITPPDDSYMIPYTWGYYGTDGFVTRFIQKPVLSYYSGYEINPSISTMAEQLYDTIKYNRTAEFRAFLDVLNIKYILQRDDIEYNFTGRNIIPPDQMQAFFAQQLYIRQVQKFGQLDIYEYTDPKPNIYALSPDTINHISLRIENISLLERSWNFASLADVQEWQNATPSKQWDALVTVSQDNDAIKTELWNSTWGWKSINSPLMPARYGDTLQIQADIKGQNAYLVHVKMIEYDSNNKVLSEDYVQYVNSGTFDWTHSSAGCAVASKNTTYVRVEIWHGHFTDQPFPNTIWIKNVKVNGYVTTLNTTGLNLIFSNTTQDSPATVLSYKRTSPTRITATVNASQPFILAVSEALDQSWTAYTNGKGIKPAPLYLGLAGFYINQTGHIEITIEYEPQKWFYYASIISATAFIACLALLTYTWTKDKSIWERIKTTLKKIRQTPNEDATNLKTPQNPNQPQH